MLASQQVIFSAVEGLLDRPGADSQSSIAEAMDAITRAGVPLVLCSHGTRAQLDPIRRKLQHGHPFLTESGGGLFVPDGYFNLHLEGAVRRGRYFCVPFARSHSEAAAAVQEIAGKADASVVAFSQMSPREIARNTGRSTQDAEQYRQREFSEIFFSAGETGRSAARFTQIAREKGWEAIPGEPFWELRGPLIQNGQSVVRYLMGIYRKALHGRQRSVGVGSHADDAYFLSATDTAVLLPGRAGEFDEAFLARFPLAARTEQSGAEGWSEAVARILEKPQCG